MLMRKQINNHDDWIAARKAQGIGASSAAAIVGMSPWKTNVDLWKELTGQAEAPDLSGNELVQQGHRVEPAFRSLFQATHPEFEVQYSEFDLLFQSENPWLFSTLDGILVDKESARTGILEIKSSSPTNKAAWQKWDCGIPQQYYIQILHQLLSTGFDFAILFAGLFKMNGEILIKQPYVIERSDVQDDLDYLLSEEKKFWQCVCEKRMPGMRLTI